jgi:hypothetical protein
VAYLEVLMKESRILVLLAALTGCSAAVPPGQPVPLTGESKTVVVRGEYRAIDLDRVDRVSIDGTRLILHGSAGTVAVDAPASADLSAPTRNWSLVTDFSSPEARRRSVTFTHNMSLDEFTIELPPGEAPLRFGTFTSPTGEVMVFAWGDGTGSHSGWVTIQGSSGSSGSAGSSGSNGSGDLRGASPGR